MANVKTILKNVNRRSFTNNTQKVAFKLLNAEGQWIPRSELERVASSASARVRDLRKPQFGRFNVECESATSLNKKGGKGTYFYRIKPTTVSAKQVSTIFNV